jgi:hypothetical protein
VRWDKHFADRNPALSGAVDRRRRRVCVRRLRISEIYLLDQQRDARPRLSPRTSAMPAPKNACRKTPPRVS